MTTSLSPDQLPKHRVAAQVSVSLSHGGMMIGLDLPISQSTSQPPTSSHHTPSPPVPARVPHAPTASANKTRGLSPPLPYTATTGVVSGAATSSSDGSDTTSSRRQHRDGSSSGTSRENRILGDYTLSKTMGVGSMGKFKLATHNVTGEKVLVTPSLSTHLSSSVFSPSPSLLSRFCDAYTSRYPPQTSQPTPLK